MRVRILFLIALLGFIYPTSYTGQIFPSWTEIIPLCVFSLIFMYLWFMRDPILDGKSFAISSVTPLLIILLTPFTPLLYIAYGAIFNYISIFLLAGMRFFPRLQDL